MKVPGGAERPREGSLLSASMKRKSSCSLGSFSFSASSCSETGSSADVNVFFTLSSLMEELILSIRDIPSEMITCDLELHL